MLRARQRAAPGPPGTAGDPARSLREARIGMAREVMSADSHMDLIYLPPETFSSRMPAGWGERVPHVVEREGRRLWVSGDDVLAPYGVYGPGVTGGRRGRVLTEAGFASGRQARPSNPVERREDQQRDGVEAGGIYGIIGVSPGPFTHARTSDPRPRTAAYHADHPDNP